MTQERLVLTAAYVVAGMALLTIATMVLPASAAGGDIIISREVQPRAATRKELVPDPNPHLVNPKPNTVIESGLQGGRLGELSDSDFAGVTSGTRLPAQLLQAPMRTTHQSTSDIVRHVGGASQTPLGHSGSGALNNIDGQVNRSVQQGLRPLQILHR